MNKNHLDIEGLRRMLSNLERESFPPDLSILTTTEDREHCIAAVVGHALAFLAHHYPDLTLIEVMEFFGKQQSPDAQKYAREVADKLGLPITSHDRQETRHE